MTRISPRPNPVCPDIDPNSNFEDVWTPRDALLFKYFPDIDAGAIFRTGRSRVVAHKNAFITYKNKEILSAARENSIPPAFLGGVLWNEVGGDPKGIDALAFAVKSHGLYPGGPNPNRTSFGVGSIQLVNAARILGLPENMNQFEFFQLGLCLENDNFNINVVAKWIAGLEKQYKTNYKKRYERPRKKSDDRYSPYTEEMVRVIGKWYNAGVKDIDKMEDTDYGDTIVREWGNVNSLLFPHDFDMADLYTNPNRELSETGRYHRRQMELNDREKHRNEVDKRQK